MEISGVLSVVLGENMVQSFLMSMTHTLLCTLQSKPGEFKATKREREDDRCTEETSATTGSEGENTKSTESMTPTHRLILEPTPRPYFSHDIPISDLQFFFNFSPSLAVVLRSGALVLLDLLSMETHVCCAVGRTVDERKQVNPPLPTASVGFGRRGRTSATLVDSKSRTNVGGGISSEPYRAARLRCLVVGKPFNPCLVEKNTISLPERLCERR